MDRQMTNSPGRSARLDEVAARAGVSTATVSRFFNNPDVVAKATAEKIRAAVAEIGYVPNLLAGGLASSRSRLVAALVPHLSNSIFGQTIEAMVEQLYTEGIVVMLGLTGTGDTRLESLIKAALARRADAIILTGILEDEGLRALLQRSSTTVIEIWGLPENPIDIAVGFSHYAVGVDIARFIHSRGYLHPHLLTPSTARARERRDGLIAEWAAAGGAQITEDDVEAPVHFGSARAAFAKIRRLDPRPDVVVCGSDSLAQGVMVEAMSCGLKVPDDIAVVGFGNSSLAGEMRPTITTIDVDGARIAREAIAAMRQRALGEEIRNRTIDVGFRLIARDSA